MDGEAGTDQAQDAPLGWAMYLHLGSAPFWAFFWWQRGWWPLTVLLLAITLILLVAFAKSLVRSLTSR